MARRHVRRGLVALGAVVGAIASSASSSAATFPNPFNTARDGAPMSALESAAQVELPEGFRCSVFAAEPDVAQPIAMTTDARGRLWVAENYTYSERTVRFNAELRDRIVVFEDTDHDGRFDKRTVFWDGAQRLTSLEVGLGGVWAICLPNLLFIPDRDGDDVPDAAPEVMLDGFDFTTARHTFANGLRWGPDGWLYGRNGITVTSWIGRPGSTAAQRTPIKGGIWRFRPQRGQFEMVAEGTTNPWGMDWDAHGEAFFINTVIGHLWHMIPGAHYKRMHGEDQNSHAYELIDQHADHVHWATGEVWSDAHKSLSGATLRAGGGHAHAGLLIYQGGQWPAEWHGKLLTLNLHGRRANVERLERVGGGYVGRHDRDAFQFSDPWFRGLDLVAAPDGGVFVSDWSDIGECHNNDGVHRTSGRIFKLTYGEPVRRDADLTRLDGAVLAQLQFSDNDWLARQGRRVLADRIAAGRSVAEVEAELQRIFTGSKTTVHRLRALWALNVCGRLGEAQLLPLLTEADEHLRVWAIRLLTDDRAVPVSARALEQFVRLAERDPSGLVRLTLASTLQKLPEAACARLAAPLLAHAEDAEDHNLPLMLWYGIAPLAESPAGGFEKIIAAARLPLVQRLGARRLAEEIDTAPARLDALLTALLARDARESRQAALEGIAVALAGRRRAPRPAAWDRVQTAFAANADDALRARLRDLSALFGDGRAVEEIRRVALDASLDLAARRAALQGLIEARAPGLRQLCEELLRTNGLAATAATGLALSDDDAVATLLLKQWPRLRPPEQPVVMDALVSRPRWAAQTLATMEAGRLSRASLSVFQARQIRGYADAALTERLEKVWGVVPDESEYDLAAGRAKWKPRLAPEKLAGADRAKGRTVFLNLCAGCHTLNGEGGAIGPDLTGAARDNVDYLLENILFPSATVADAYRLTTLALKDGRVLAGMVRSRTPQAVNLQTMTGLVALPTDEIAKEETSPRSLMPPGLLDAIEPEQAADLFAYLMAK